MESRYRSLQGRQTIHPKEYYEGVYKNQPILFDRNFREYRFTDAECAALCNGEWLEVHNLKNGTVFYGVRGRIQEDIFASAKSNIPVYVFKVKTSLVNNPRYNFDKRVPNFGPKSVVSNDQKPTQQNSVTEHMSSKSNIVFHQALVDEFSTEEDAKLAAMISAPILPEIVEVPTSDGSIPIFVPVIAGHRYTKQGLEMIPDVEKMYENITPATPSMISKVTEETVQEPKEEVIIKEPSVKSVPNASSFEDFTHNTALVEGFDELYEDEEDLIACEGFEEMNERAMQEPIDEPEFPFEGPFE